MPTTVGVIHYDLPYLHEAIESAREADRIIVFDDCSPVTPVVDCELVVNEVNSGSAVWGWNQLIETCDTDWFIPLSADDRLKPGAIERIEACDADWVYADLDLIDEHGNPLQPWSYASFPHDVPGCLKHIWQTKTLFPTMLAAFRTEFVREHHLRAWHFPETQAFADTPTGTSWLGCWPRLKYLGAPLFDYRRHPGSETNSAQGEREVMQQSLTAYMTERFGKRQLDRL